MERGDGATRTVWRGREGGGREGRSAGKEGGKKAAAGREDSQRRMADSDPPEAFDAPTPPAVEETVGASAAVVVLCHDSGRGGAPHPRPLPGEEEEGQAMVEA